MQNEHKQALITAAGYTIQDNGTTHGWYVLLPGETAFRCHAADHEPAVMGVNCNYYGFFSSEQDLLDEVSVIVVEHTMDFHGLSSGFWDGLTQAQQCELAKEAHEPEKGELPQEDWRRALKIGDEVWWNDPDAGHSSGIYKIVGINAMSVRDTDTVLSLKNAAGSEAEVYASELSPAQPVTEGGA